MHACLQNEICLHIISFFAGCCSVELLLLLFLLHPHNLTVVVHMLGCAHLKNHCPKLKEFFF